jgi:RimJ/RimL family protein N-acetyltransferase
VYEGERVRLRAVEPEADTPVFHAWFGDLAVTRYLAPRYPRSLASTRERLAEWSAPSFEAARFTVERLDTGEPVGFAALRDATPEERDAELDLVVGDRTAWGGGLGTDAVRVLCRFGFDEMNLHRIHLYVFTDNAPAMAIYRTVGFVQEAVLRHAFYTRGAWHDTLLMGLLRGELRS